ncbi:putative estradiol 17 beta-dehydrogenase [Naviculisporaceae sp. PSN 640]
MSGNPKPLSPGLKTSLGHFFPPKPTFTDKDIPEDLSGKIYLITGASSGLGKELARVLYNHNATVYCACRSEEKTRRVIEEIVSNNDSLSTDHTRNGKGALHFIPLDQSDLASVKACAETFLSREKKLDALFNNAGVMTGPGEPIPRTAQGHELALGVNCLGAFLLTRLLTPVLISTAKSYPGSSGAVRVIWLSSFGPLQYAPFEKGIDMGNLDYQKETRPGIERYGLSKCGVWLLGVEFGKRLEREGVTSVVINPGNLLTELARDAAWWLKMVGKMLCYKSIFGVYTLLFATFSPDVAGNKVDWTKEWVIPWGRVDEVRTDLPKAVLPEEEGGNGNSTQFWEWCETKVKDFL